MRDPAMRDNPFAEFGIKLLSAMMGSLLKCADDYNCARRLATMDLPQAPSFEDLVMEPVLENSE